MHDRPRLGTTARKVAGLARWLGVAGGRVELPREVTIVSPHLDDGPFSLGAAASYAARHGARVTLLTVFAGDPGSDIPAGDWDRRAGFATEGEAARTRRDEDRRACKAIGARPVWLPYPDHQYHRRADEMEVRAATLAAIGDAYALLPGFPLMHDDHRRLRNLLDGTLDPERTMVYAEQPYAALWIDEPGLGGVREAGPAPGPGKWRLARAAPRDQLRKIVACRAYSSQLPMLAPQLARRILRYEMRVGGEAVAPADTEQ